jgi:hypothetical protein
VIKLSSIELKLLRLIFDQSAQANEAEVSRRKLIDLLTKRGLSGHDLVEALDQSDHAIVDGISPRMSKPDYGLYRMPFGKSKGQLFMDLAPYDLRSARRWAMSKPELAQKFAEFIHDVDEFLKQGS